MKLGAITDGISRDYEYALQQMQRYGLKYPELQYVWEKEIGDHSEEELERIRTLTEQYGMTISVISRQTFMGMQTMATQPDSLSGTFSGASAHDGHGQAPACQNRANDDLQQDCEYLGVRRCGSVDGRK